MKLSDHNRRTLMITLHKKIEEYADKTADCLYNGETSDLIVYPPNGGLTNNELRALKKLENDQDLKTALRKVLADQTGEVVFDLMNIFDGTEDPDEHLGKWTEIAIVDQSDDIDPNNEMLHDDFFSTYWDWKKLRPDSNWALDTE
jgi:hypothetical protein